jgi:amino acid adenylation domain-containing protein
MGKETLLDTSARLIDSACELATLVELLRWRASQQADQIGYIFESDDGPANLSMTYSELDRKARAIACMLQNLGAARRPVLLLYPPGLDFIEGFFGCLYAGAIAVPAYPPDPRRLSRTLPRLQAIVADTGARFVLGTSSVLSLADKAFEMGQALETLRRLATDEVPANMESSWGDHRTERESTAFLQYTSGSTSDPKGVILTHANLLHNAAMVRQAFEHTSNDKYVSWLPTFHDMGFMAGVLQPLYSGIPVTLLSPESFLRHPLRWLEAISKFKGTTSGGPNFAYELCVRRVSPQERASLDLSSWTIAFNGAEPVRRETLDRFAKTFEVSGFRRNAFYPCYGLAEATLIVSGGLKSSPPMIKSFKTSGLEEKRAMEASPYDEGDKVRSLVCSGRSLSNQQVLIVDPYTRLECPPGEIAEIWISGPSVAGGYWNNTEETQRVFNAALSNTGAGPYLRTEDLGFVLNGDLYIAGRIKDLIIIRGVNHYPQDIEATVERSDPSFRPGCCAAFSVEVNEDERLVVVQEVSGEGPQAWDSTIEAIQRNIAQQHELQAHAIVLIKKGTIHKTSSGKIQRQACRKAFLEQRLDVAAIKIEWQSEPEPPTCSLPMGSLTVEEIQVRLTSFICSRLGLDPSKIDVNVPLISYGLDSLVAVELMHSIETMLGIRLPVSRFLDGPSIAQLVMLAWNNRTAQSELSLNTKPVFLHPSEFPLSAGQKGLWFIGQMLPDNPVYNISRAIRIKSPLDTHALRECFQALMDRHALLRAHFTAPDGEPVQRISQSIEISFQEIDASAWSEDAWQASLVEAAYRPFDLETSPLLRLSLLTRSSDDHVLLLSIHHIIADFWSLAVLFHEMAELYGCKQLRTKPALSSPGAQYSDYVRKQAEWLASADGELHLQFWREHLGGDLPVLQLHTDRPRTIRMHRGTSCNFSVGSEATMQLRSLANKHSATMYMVLLAAFQTLLHRYTQQEDLIVGSATSGRNYADYQGVVGYFINPIAVRVNVSGELAFSNFLANVRQTVLSVLEHQEYPFQVLVEQLRPHRLGELSPIFQTMFSFQKAPLLTSQDMGAFALGLTGGSMVIGGLTFESVGLDERVSQFDLTLMMAEANGGLLATFQYDTDLFDRTTVERMSSHLQMLLKSLTVNPAQPIWALALFNNFERNQILVDWNQTLSETPTEKCFHELFEAQVHRTPHAIALAFREQKLTYGELNRKANRLSHRLRESEVGPEVTVGVCLEPSLELMIVLLGILKAGGAFVPLDPEYPSQRLAAIVQSAGISVVIAQEKTAQILEKCGATLILVDKDWKDVSSYSQENLINRTDPENLAYVMYTSGSTGSPKGVMIPHRGLVNYLAWCVEGYHLHRGEGSLVHTSIAFDLTLTSLFAPLLAGKKVEILERVPGVESLSSSLSKARELSFLKLTPSHLSLLAEQVDSQSAACVNFLILGGEALSKETAAQWQRLAPATRLVNEYGPTETVVGCCVYFMQEESANTASVPIGRPVANTQIYVLDSYLQPVPIDVSGELFIGGTGPARGYMNRSDLTAEKFIPDPYSSDAGSRLYKTGDRACRSADGTMQFLGRSDGQVKIRGYRIELEEIEAVLEDHPAISRAIVLAQYQQERADRLVGYLVADQGLELRTPEIRSYLKQRLPDYLVPAVFVVLDSLPVTHNGKLNKHLLPSPDGSRPDLEMAFVEPRNQIERSLASLWEEILGLDRVGIHDNFFDLGGHSLLATRVNSRVRRVFNISLPVRSLFDYPTVGSLAQAIGEMQKQAEVKKEPRIQPIARGSIKIEDFLNNLKNLS